MTTKNQMKNIFAFVITIGLASALFALHAIAQKTKKPAAAPKSIRIDISKDKVGGESSKFLSVVGNWSVVDDGGKKAYAKASANSSRRARRICRSS
jgi:hypothetical protein